MIRRASPPRHRGAALLIAMLTVALVATFAAASLWQQWRSIEVEGAERARVQSAWVLTGALDWARLLLREDARAGGPDHLGEPWAVPLQEARLSSFLAADQNNTADMGPEVLEAFLSGQIIDLQSLLNVTNLADKTRASEPDVRAFRRLFDLLGLPPEQLDRLVENMRLALEPGAPNPGSPLPPQRVEELVWLGLPAATIAALQPYITVLPVHTGVNLNTAPPEVIFAALDGISMADAQRLVAERERTPFKTPEDAKRLITSPEAALTDSQVVAASNYFEVRSRLRLDKLVVEERAVLFRGGLDVSVVQRERGIPDARALTQAAAKR
ncbi:type II secretion system minor pseudopilin GspK [Caenimonas aquaedulcis]|uniref:Type II secretion system protein K n=1 Tax=Caenimonas aquaedulcis TaxID=2793270 RepID=A0A931H6M4_9BURK|nr:type II secretion system minor pseudopilin GspK [Caenimonas aquaedulcis]MBG9389355.1 type II secretion system minor pseudopilin GspK [Caenimonas aquaedulcis]